MEPQYVSKIGHALHSREGSQLAPDEYRSPMFRGPIHMTGLGDGLHYIRRCAGLQTSRRDLVPDDYRLPALAGAATGFPAVAFAGAAFAACAFTGAGAVSVASTGAFARDLRG